LNLNEEEDIFIETSVDIKQSTRSTNGKAGNSSLNSEISCTMSSVEAKPFYPTKIDTNSIWENDVSEFLSNSDG
jgi:hypothetical protein